MMIRWLGFRTATAIKCGERIITPSITAWPPMLVNCVRGFTIEEYRTRNRLLLLIFVQETLNATFCIDQLMLAGKERMTAGADFHLDIFFGGPRLNDIAACASHGGFYINWVNSLFHRFLEITNPRVQVNLSPYGQISPDHSCLLRSLRSFLSVKLYRAGTPSHPPYSWGGGPCGGSKGG